MTGARVLRIYHSAVVPEYRERERLLRERHGWDVHVVVPPFWREGGRLVAAGLDDRVPVHVVPVRGRTHPILFWYSGRALRRVIREVRPHLVDVHEEPYSLAAAGAMRAAAREAPAAPVCIYTAQNILKRYPLPFRTLQRRVLDRVAAAYPCSREAAAVLRAKGFRGAVHVLPLGVSADRERPRGAEGRAVVGFVGRLVPEKGGELAVRAFAEATRGNGALLEVVGAGPEAPRLRALAASLGVGDRVSFVGAVPQSEALERIRGFDVLLVPSLSTSRWKEQFGRVVAQALAAGTPVVASACGSLPELLQGCGELAREGDASDLAVKLSGLLRDPARREALADAGRRRAHARLSWERVAAGFDRMYREALAGG